MIDPRRCRRSSTSSSRHRQRTSNLVVPERSCRRQRAEGLPGPRPRACNPSGTRAGGPEGLAVRSLGSSTGERDHGSLIPTISRNRKLGRSIRPRQASRREPGIRARSDLSIHSLVVRRGPGHGNRIGAAFFDIGTDCVAVRATDRQGLDQGVALVMIFGFFVMGILAYRTYTASMPMPGKVVTQSGDVLFTGDEITRGQELFLARGLQEYGSILGHGAYLGPDYTADYLRMATDDVTAQFRAEGVSEPRDRVVQEFRTNRYDDATATLVFTDRQAAAFENIQRHYAAYFGENSTKYGLLPKFITDDAEIHDLTAFFAWTAWASAAERPGHDYTYTNNWPPSRGWTTAPPRS